MPKYHASLLIFCLLTASCSSTPDLGDLPLQNQNLSARLFLADGLPPFPSERYYLALPGYVFATGAIVMHPGVRQIAYACPGDWPWQQVTHFTPSVKYDFQAGHSYELYCIDGYPKIRLTQ